MRKLPKQRWLQEHPQIARSINILPNAVVKAFRTAPTIPPAPTAPPAPMAPDGFGRLRKAADCSGRLQTAPDGSGRLRRLRYRVAQGLLFQTVQEEEIDVILLLDLHLVPEADANGDADEAGTAAVITTSSYERAATRGPLCFGVRGSFGRAGDNVRHMLRPPLRLTDFETAMEAVELAVHGSPLVVVGGDSNATHGHCGSR
uniref:Endonuclease/exonuclease/phosphatase domain-containing protein n=1 Tax=Anopheles atroparvus TaxID=41427 RepID=A0A182JLF3_ANOAO